MVAARCWPSAGRLRRQSRPGPSKPAQLRKPSHLSARGRPRPLTDSDEFRQRTWKRNYDCVPRRADGQSASDNGSETCAETPYETCLLYIHTQHTCHSANADFQSEEKTVITPHTQIYIEDVIKPFRPEGPILMVQSCDRRM